ncbi:MAG TPA: hypothetical protein DD725_02325 [Deltaproteobacteria bacterium]|nr:MAG: hypothetical protein A2Z89_08585 [Deltaproteobacteria bacterium GWA2_43_19]OGQ12838.1 MAG: hypothetical protein A3D30_02420 [Deltaproteobacteria bacterium RIFCSPHIGHO2_02_FULL_43_33]HBR16436.1 hypothetical protein [Deltaproteobacteria bacterium]
MIRYHITRTPNRKPRISRIFYITHLLFFLTLIFSFAYAGEYHNSTNKGAPAETLACSQCHSMHGSQGGVSMVYDESTRGYGGSVNAVYSKLLRQSNILNLCLFCHHDNEAAMGAPDVWDGGNITNQSAGLLCYNIGGSPPCADSAKNHTVDVNVTVTVPGTISSPITLNGFTCVNCHNPHGTTSYRNLRDNGTIYAPPGSSSITYMAVGETITYSMTTTATRDNTKYVNMINLPSLGQGLDKYKTSNVVFKLAPTTNTAGIQGFCKSCHTDFHGAGGDSNMGGAEPTNPWKRHPTRDTSIGTGATNLHADSACWIAGTTAAGCAEAFNTTGWNRVIDPNTTDENNGTAVPFCLTCHRAHGSTNHSNLIFGPPTSVGGAGTMMRQTCQQCHNQ